MSKSRKPVKEAAAKIVYDAFSVRDYEVAGETRSDWSRIGTAWPHADGDGFRVLLHCLPVDGVVTLRLSTRKISATE